MKKYIFENKDLTKSFTILVGVLAVVFRLCLSYTQFATIYPPLAPIDDDLMTRAAMSIVKGEWLGEYGYLTISKHAFFAVWLAFLHVLGVPLLVGNMALWAFASLCAASALAPAIKKRYARLGLFLILLYNPAASACYATRIYRDAIFPSLCLIFFAGVIGAGLRYKENIKKLLPYYAMYGVSFGCVYLCREDGVWVLPFFAVALLVVSALLIAEKQPFVKKAASMLLPFAASAVIICLYCRQNYIHYGRFIVSDFTSKEFKSAYGAMTSLKQDDWDPMVAVPSDVREDLYANIDFFAPVKQALEDPLLKGGYYNEKHGDFTSGAFYWALRRALSDLGYYENAQTSKEYYEKLTLEIQSLVDGGILETQNGSNRLRKSVTPPIKAEYVPAVLAETFAGFRCVIGFSQCDPLAERAVGTEEEINPVADFINQQGATACIPYTDTPYLSPVRAVTHAFMRAVRVIYSVLIPIMLAITAMWQIKTLLADISAKTFNSDSLLNIVLLGVIGMALLRCRMIAFVEVSSFGIGTYVMYLSTVHPLVLLYSFIGTAKTFEY